MNNRFGLKSQYGAALGFRTESPGPGAYNAKARVGNEGFKSSIAPRRPDTSPFFGKNVPGPGTYTPKIQREGIPSFKVGSSQRSKLNNESLKVPGPGAYNLESKKAGPGWG